MSDSHALLARQLAGFVQALGFLLGRLAGSKNKREQLRDFAKLQARVCTANWGPESNALVRLLEITLSVPVEGDMVEREFQHLVQAALQGGQLPPEPLASKDEIAAVLRKASAHHQAEPMPQKKRTTRKKAGGKK